MNETTFNYEYRSVIKMFEEQAALHPERDAVVTSKVGLDYEMLNEQANKVANSLLFLHLQKEESVMILMPRSISAYIAELGILKAGGAFVFANPQYPDDRVDFMFKDSEARFVLTTKAIANERVGLFKSLQMTPLLLEQLVSNPNSQNPGIEPGENQLAYMIYTSGSTGRPKGVMIEHGNLTNFVHHNPKNTETMGIVEHGHVMLAMAPLTFDVSIMEAFIALTSGMTLAMVTEAEILSPSKMKNFFQINNVDAACVTPAYMNTLASIPDMHEALKQFKVIDFGAEAFPSALYTKLRNINPDVRILNGYGPTEATISCTVKEITSDEHITIGKPNANVYAYVVDENLNVVPHGEEGELLICGKGVGRGYKNLPEKTAEVFVEYKGMRGYRTGDLVRLDANDEIEFIGRKDFQVKLRGLRIELGEVEEVVSSYPSVQLCAAAAVDNRFLVVYYTATENIDPAALKEYAKQSLAHYMVPDIFMQLDTMPLTANRKIDRKALPRPEIHAEKIIPPTTDTQKKILEIFTAIVDGMPQSITANIMELGVSSLDAMMIIAKLAEAFDNTFKIADIYENPTAQKMEAFIQASPKETIFVTKDRYPAAQREHFYYHMFGSDTTYNICYCYELDASLDITKLKNAITHAIDMHRGLLSRYEMTNDQLWHIPAPADEHLIPEIIHMSDQEFDAQKPKLITKLDLEKSDPLMTVKIYITETRRLLVLNIHHCIIDGESLEILLQDIAAAYDGKEIKSEDISIFQFMYESDMQLERARKHCREYYNALIPQIPTMHSLTPDGSDPNGQMAVSKTLSISRSAIQTYCSKIGITPSVLLYGLVGLLLSSEEKLHDSIVMTTFNGRNDTRFTRLVGMLSSSIPLFCHWSEDMKLRDYLRNLLNQVLHSMIMADVVNDCVQERYQNTWENVIAYQPEGTDEFEIGKTLAKGAEVPNPNQVMSDMMRTATQLYEVGDSYFALLIFNNKYYTQIRMIKLLQKLDGLFTFVEEDITIGELLRRADDHE